MLKVRYFDGVSSRAQIASAYAKGRALHIVGNEVERVVDGVDLRFAPATGLGPARISFASGGLCEFDDRAGAEALFLRLGHRPSHAERMSSKTRYAIGITVAFVAVMAVLYRWGIPWIADEAIRFAPHSWDVSLGESTLQTLDRQSFFKPSKLSILRREEIVERFHALRAPTGGSALLGSDLVLEFRRLGVPNALALPGNTIVVTDEIIDEADETDDDDNDAALLTVLAHEAGHVAHRDAMRQIARSALSSMVAAWYFGDVSSAVAVIAGGIGALSYSREAERQADLYAVDTMNANGISTHAAADLFRRLEVWKPPKRAADKKDDNAKSDDTKKGEDARKADDTKKDDETKKERKASPFRPKIPEYLSTHPDTDGRIKLFEDNAVATKKGA